jgi:hypothetical protein
VGDERFAALERLAHTHQIRRGGLMSKSVTALLASARAISRTCRRPRSAAHHTASRTITPTLTHGHLAGRRHRDVRRTATRFVRCGAGRRARYHFGQRDG